MFCRYVGTAIILPFVSNIGQQDCERKHISQRWLRLYQDHLSATCVVAKSSPNLVNVNTNLNLAQKHKPNLVKACNYYLPRDNKVLVNNIV